MVIVTYASDRGTWIEAVSGTADDARLRALAMNWRIVYIANENNSALVN